MLDTHTDCAHAHATACYAAYLCCVCVCVCVCCQSGIIPPNQTMEVDVSAHVTSRTALPLLTGADTLDDILILRLENGRDYFVTCMGDYQRSCFGATIDFLINTHIPVRFTSIDKKAAAGTAGGGGAERPLSIPKELWRLVDWIFRHAIDHEHIFTRSGVRSEVDAIREALDVGSDLDALSLTSVHSMCEALLLFLKSLAAPVFPEWLVEQYSENAAAVGGVNASLTAFCKQALQQLTPAHYNVFVYIVAFLRETLKRADANRASVQQLVLSFAAALFATHPDVENMQSDATQKDKMKTFVILKHFLVSEEFI